MPLVYNLINNNTEYEVGVGSCGDNVVVPDTYLGLPVTSIAATAFFSCFSLKSIIISNNVKNIGIAGFSACSSLESIILPDQLTSIPGGCFDSCFNLTNITIPKLVTSIGVQAFYNCINLTRINFLGNQPTDIGQFAFANTNFRIKFYRKKNFVTGWNSTLAGKPVVLWPDNTIKSGGTGKLVARTCKNIILAEPIEDLINGGMVNYNMYTKELTIYIQNDTNCDLVEWQIGRGPSFNNPAFGIVGGKTTKFSNQIKITYIPKTSIEVFRARHSSRNSWSNIITLSFI